MTMIQITKIEAAEIQLSAAIRLFFSEGHPVVVETLIGAASGVLRGLAVQFGLKSILHDSDLIRPECRSKWRRDVLHEQQNFIKHADEDPFGTMDYEPQVLHNLTLEACILYRQLASGSHFERPLVNEPLFFEVWFRAKYPHLLIDPVPLTTMMPSFAHTKFDPDDFELMRMVLGIT